jgi:hypothetical protein
VDIEDARSGNGADYLFGNELANVLDSGGGNDFLVGGGGADTFKGGQGSDTYLADGSAKVTIIDKGGENDRFFFNAPVGTTFEGIEYYEFAGSIRSEFHMKHPGTFNFTGQTHDGMVIPEAIDNLNLGVDFYIERRFSESDPVSGVYLRPKIHDVVYLEHYKDLHNLAIVGFESGIDKYDLTRVPIDRLIGSEEFYYTLLAGPLDEELNYRVGHKGALGPDLVVLVNYTGHYTLQHIKAAGVFDAWQYSPDYTLELNTTDYIV